MANRKPITLIILVIFCALLACVFFYNTNYAILGIKDVFIMLSENRAPALTIPKTNEKYYNKWQCFSVEIAEITEAEVNYNGWHKVPSINVKIKNGVKSFDLDPDVKWDNASVIGEWKDLVKDQRSICIFGVFLQKEENGSSLWYIQKIKTKKGYWDRLNLVTY